MKNKKKYVYLFKESHGLGKELLGGKGAGLAEMTYVGIPIPQGFTVTTEVCNLYYSEGKKLPEEVVSQVMTAIRDLEKETGKEFGGKKNPLLLSVRSGARVSMPGMMDTILNLGLNDETAAIMVKETNNPRFVADSYRRFILMYTNVVKGLPRDEMDKMLDDMKAKKGVELDTDLDADDLNLLVKQYKEYYKNVTGEDFPSDPHTQLLEAIKAVFRSWDNERANIYRKMHHIPYEWGTAVNVQAMVFGNKGETSGTGVAFSRSPATGEKFIFAEYLPNAQGEDVVAGIRTPLHIDWLAENMPEVHAEFTEAITRMERHYKDMQDMEFTVEDGTLYFLQTRNGKRTAQAALKIACDLLDEGLITEEEAVLRVEPAALDSLLHMSFDQEALKKTPVLAEGLPASPGAATGKLVFTADEAAARHEKGEKVILVRQETSPEDLAGMVAAEGILTMRGGMTSHAAVVARGMGKCCIVGATSIIVDDKAHTLTIGGRTFGRDDVISIDGSTGRIYEGEIKLVPAQLTGNFDRIMKLADKFRRLEVRTNADTPRDAKQAKEFGAQGIGLCRTEHMFFDADRIFHMRKMILSDNVKDREDALREILPHQENDFYELFLAMDGLPVTVRLLDPPLHEFLPHEEHLIEELAKELHTSTKQIHDRINALHEFNPMMGHRGVRLTITYPEICRMQTTAVINAALRAQKTLGKNLVAEIMVPLIFGSEELRFVKGIIEETAEALIKASGQELEYHVGTMMEIPRATLLAGEIAKEAAFFSFGTNDLTQMTFGFSRDDATKFLPDYYERRLLEQDPFATIDQKGVGQLVEKAVKDGKKANKKLLVGICGEHGGDPKSIEFFDRVGLDYVSCSPYRVPIARLAAAHAAIMHKK
ncbi:MAG: pyruvate, phosphate dikinase [Bacilli bacterium]|jgi:pyruvate,orthophosphate dikinase